MAEMKRVFNANRWRDVEEGPVFDKMIADGWVEVKREGVLIPDLTAPVDVSDAETLKAFTEARGISIDDIKPEDVVKAGEE